jgi:hypothetical protein
MSKGKMRIAGFAHLASRYELSPISLAQTTT